MALFLVRGDHLNFQTKEALLEFGLKCARKLHISVNKWGVPLLNGPFSDLNGPFPRMS